MTQYSDTAKQRLLETPIECVLATFGKRTDHDRHNFYYSPFRDERTPSFRVFPDTNRWYDFGTGEGGGLLKLVSMLKGCRPSEAWDVLATVTYVPETEPSPRIISQGRHEPAIVIDSISPAITTKVLRDYATQRRFIPEPILDRYCEEVTYHVKSCPGSRYCAIGFQNDSAGYVLRSPMSKRCTLSDITTISTGALSVTVFEGFFDFLSWLVLNSAKTPSTDICVLNSVTNAAKALPKIAGYQTVTLCLDNDPAGRQCTGEMTSWLEEHSPGATVMDGSTMYAGHKDLGEMLVSLRTSTERIESPATQTIKHQYNGPAKHHTL